MSASKTLADYFGESIVVGGSTTSGAWMMMQIMAWDTDAVGLEAFETYDTYMELPSLARKVIQTICGTGGTAVYETVNSLIHQYGSPQDVPTQGYISESVSGLKIEIVNIGAKGIRIYFWAE